VQIRYGFALGLDEATSTAIFSGIGALLVVFVSNLKVKPDAAAALASLKRRPRASTNPCRITSAR
jgi:hypothetical protein